MEKAARQWTLDERQDLFDKYFGPFPGICPVCAREVCMVMSNWGRTVMLLLSCDGCGNKAQVSRDLPLQGPLRPTSTTREVPPTEIRTSEEQDESQCA